MVEVFQEVIILQHLPVYTFRQPLTATQLQRKPEGGSVSCCCCCWFVLAEMHITQEHVHLQLLQLL